MTSHSSDRYLWLLRVMLWSFLGIVFTGIHVESQSIIQKVVVQPSGLLSRGELTHLREFELPGPWDEAAVERTRQNLLATHRFTEVGVYWDPPAGTVTFTLTPQPFVKKIRFKGVQQVDKRRLFGVMDLQKYHAIKSDSLEKAAKQIAEYYQWVGLPIPEIQIKTKTNDENGSTAVWIAIAEQPLRIPESVTFHLDGHPSLFERLRLQSSLKLFRWRTLRNGYNREALKILTAKTGSRLRASGYLEAEWSVDDHNSDENTSDFDVNIDMKVGKRVKIKGSHIGFFTSRDIVRSWRRRNVPLTELEITRLKRRAEEVLQKQGYLDVRISTEQQETNNKIILDLIAEKGPRYFIESLQFDGNETIPDRKLMKLSGLHPPRLFHLIRSRPTQEMISSGINTISSYYRSMGYPDVRVESEVASGDSPKSRVVRYVIQSGSRRTSRRITFTGALVFTPERLLEITQLKVNDPYTVESVNFAETLLKKEYWRMGYSDVMIQSQVHRPDEQTVDIEFTIQEGSPYTISAVVVQGNYKTKSSLLLGSERLTCGEPFDYAPVAQAQQDYYNLNVFDSVNIRTHDSVEPAELQKAIIVDVTEQSTGLMEMGMDINTDRGLEFIGKIGDRNVFGRAVNVNVGGLAGLKRRNIAFNLSQPYLFGTHLSNFFKASYSDDRSNSGFYLYTMAFSTGISRDFQEHLRGSVLYSYERETASNIDSDVYNEISFASGSTASVWPSLTWDSRDDPFMTSKGLLCSSGVKGSLDFLGGQSSFYRWEMDTRYYRTFWEELTVVGALRIGHIWAVGGEGELPLGERFFSGGANTHRGFSEKDLGPLGSEGSPLGGQTYLLSNIEMRVSIWRNLGAGVFADIGNVYLTTPDPPYLRPAAGVGLRYKTPFGPLRGDIGFNLDRQEGESLYSIHFAIGHAF